MIIAPGQDVDRNWVPEGAGSGWCWMPRPSLAPVTWSLPHELDWVTDDARIQPEKALPQRWSSPSWSIDLWFYVWDRLIVRGGVKLPTGYVLPGLVVGVHLERSDLCVVCRARAVEYSRTGGACCEEHADA